ncbi:hypothetical protein HY440_03500 [Candidatus Microgenomates bacterium]|nr:hypothetical protein [Candidatus Microgenomates bacterium]
MGERLISCRQLSSKLRQLQMDVRYILFKDGTIHIQSYPAEVHRDVLKDTGGKTIQDIVRAGYFVDTREDFGFISVDARGSTTVQEDGSTIGDGDVRPVSKVLATLPDFSRFKFKFYQSK